MIAAALFPLWSKIYTEIAYSSMFHPIMTTRAYFYVMIFRIIPVFLTILPAMLMAQSPKKETKAVHKVIQQVFDGMREGDSAKVRAQFLPEATLNFMGENKEGKPAYGQGSMQRWLDGIGSEKPEAWDERINDVEIRIDGRMAMGWVPYKFYLGKKFLHCGVNLFTLFKGADGWKVMRITDTRREDNCIGD